MQLTPFHAKYYAYNISNQSAQNNITKIAATLSDANVDLNPHQVEAALFALKSPLSAGVILADEVGLGKTIEAGLVIAQKWHEGRRRIIIIVPASLRLQWQSEMEEKFYLPSVILERKSFDNFIKSGVENPFAQEEIIITSYQFANAYAQYIEQINFDMAVFDEAHRLKNIYKQDNIIAKTLKSCLKNSFKLLLTATPLQNTILELYGLISFIDDYSFGDVDTYKTNFINARNEFVYDDLEQRLKRLCTRTLRKQVLEYIRYTNRIPITQEFSPLPAEQELYDKITAYLQRDSVAVSKAIRHLISIMLWKMLASSSFAIAGTLEKFVLRLKSMEEITTEDIESSEELIKKPKKRKLSEKDKARITAEITELQEYIRLAKAIQTNAKGEALLLALEKGFAKLKELKAPQKAVIFTESRRTQLYLYALLQSKYKNHVLLHHGGMTKDERRVAKEAFMNDGKILIATESASEGLNLQFCCCIINYDLPWNPQRIEQRIGRLHRYKQKHDVIVINFLNKENPADKRVYELLSYKFNLFEGMFGASDSILGVIDSIDFEKRINDIYSLCRTEKEINEAFDNLQRELDEVINDKMCSARRKLIENFDEEVTDRLKLNYFSSTEYLCKLDQMFWELTKHELAGYADFDEAERKFTLFSNPYYDSKHGYKRLGGDYQFSKTASVKIRYRLKCSLAQTILSDVMQHQYIGNGEVVFDLSGHDGKISTLESLKGKSGYLSLYELRIYSKANSQRELIFVGRTSDGKPLRHEQLKRLFDLSGSEIKCHDFKAFYEEMNTESKNQMALLNIETERISAEIEAQNHELFCEESDKLCKWASDICLGLERSIKKMDKEISELYAQKQRARDIKTKLDFARKISTLEQKRIELRMDLYLKQDEVNKKRDELIESTEKKLDITIKSDRLFMIKWRVV